MSEQEPQEPQPPQKGIALNPIYGAVPALIGAVLVIAHLRQPLVPAEDQSIVMNACLGLICLSLAMWLHYGMERVVRRFDERHERAEAEAARRHAEAETAAAERHAAADAAAAARHAEAEAAAVERHAELMDEMTRLRTKANRLCGQMKLTDRRLEAIEKQGIALGKMFIDEGLPSSAGRAN